MDQKIFPLSGKVQHYDWGGKEFLPALLQLDNPEGKPFAEYWMGAHPNASSEVAIPGNGMRALSEWVRQEPVTLLGAPVQVRFGRLPYLFKVLDVKDMLSIQVHPSKKAAGIEFARENEKGVPLTAPHRNYKDDNHKPELMLALSDFWLLHGFKPKADLLAVLGRVPELQELKPVFEQGGYKALYQTVMEKDQADVDRALQPLLDRILPLYDQGVLDRSDADFWAARAAKTFNKNGHIDRGIYSVYFFNLVHVQPGEAVFQDAGVPHAYLEGQNMEIMANSDNVLRGGLTNKHVDVPELMKHIRFEETIPDILRGTPVEDTGERIYASPAPEFRLSSIVLGASGEIHLTATTAEIFFVYRGEVNVAEGKTILHVAQGHTLLAIAGADMVIRAVKDAILYRATVPGE